MLKLLKNRCEVIKGFLPIGKLQGQRTQQRRSNNLKEDSMGYGMPKADYDAKAAKEPL